jgi:sugar lactone lactonase YvrE
MINMHWIEIGRLLSLDLEETPKMKRWSMGAVAMLLVMTASGCSDDEPGGGSAGAPASGGAGAGGEAGSGGDGGGGGSGGEGGAGGAPALEVLVSFDAAAFELPEGLVIHDGNAYASLAMLGEVREVSLAGGAASSYAQVEGLPVDNAFVTGLTFDAAGRLYAAVPSFVANPLPGVYRADAGGGPATLFATDAAMVFPSALELDAAGQLYVTDSAAGAVFRVAGDGTAEIFAQDPLLLGDKTICGNDAALFDIGANGLVVTASDIYVANTDQATIVRIPIEAGGAGTPVIFAGPDCATLGGIDGMTRASDGTFYVALNRQNRIATVSASGAVEVVLEDPLLDFPASVGLTPSEDRLLITSFALEKALAGEEAAPALLSWRLR